MPVIGSFSGGSARAYGRGTKGVGIVATGGNRVLVNGFYLHQFTGSGSFVVTSAPTNSTVEVVTVAGGGGAGTGTAGQYVGAGGAGGLFANTVAFGNAVPVTAGTYSVTVGGGGAAAANGSNSSFGALTTTGGGCGGPVAGNGANGGSGGGGGVYGTYGLTSTAGGTGIVGQGNNGAGGFSYNWSNAGGGGGAASAAQAYGGFGSPSQGGLGYYNPNFAPFGDDLQPGTFASGGSAFQDAGGGYAPGNVVVGGGGSMAYPTPKPNTGGGAGGQVGTGGASGVVVIRYPA